MGKWSALAKTYPQLPEDPSRLEAMRAHLDRFRDLTLADLAAAHDAADDRRKEAEAEASVAGLERDAARIILAEKIQRAGMDRATIGGYNYTPDSEPWPVITNKADLIAYGINGHPEVITYAHGTVKTLLKAFLEGEGDHLPGVDVYMKPKLSRTKASGK